MEIEACGHPEILATHKTTIEITKESHVTKKGDCIVGVSSSHSLKDLKPFLKDFKGRWIKLIFKVENKRDEVFGFVHPKLIFEDEKDIVLRKSDFLCKRTLMIKSNKAAIDLDREIVKLLKKGFKLKVEFSEKFITK